MTITAPEAAAADLEIARLRTELAQARDAHRSDVAVIGEMLLRKAEYYAWCGEYDDAVNEINERLHIPLPMRERRYYVTVRGYLRVPYRHTVAVTVTADGDLEEAALEAMDNVGVDDVSAMLEDAELEDDPEVVDSERI